MIEIASLTIAKRFPIHVLWPTPNGKYTKEFGLYVGNKKITTWSNHNTNHNSYLPWTVESKSIRNEGKRVIKVLGQLATCHCRKLYVHNAQTHVTKSLNITCMHHLYILKLLPLCQRTLINREGERDHLLNSMISTRD